MRATDPVIAEKDVTIVDSRGLRVQIVAGSEVPRTYINLYNEATGKRKAQRGPDIDKAQRAPDTGKSRREA